MSIAADLGKRPISESLPAGSEVRDSAEFDQVQNEIAKLSSVSGDSVVNWGELTPLCATILTSQGKDLLIACYLAGGLLETEGPAGLAKGLGIVDEMLQTYWDSLFPSLKRLRARRNALQWLSDRISQKAGETSWQEQPVDSTVIDAMLASLRAIDATLQDKDDEAPSMRPLIELLGRLPRMAKEVAELIPASTPSVTTENPLPVTLAAAPSPTSVSAAPAAAPLDNNLAAAQAATLLGQRVGELAEWYQGIDLENPASYRLKRIALWSAIEALPGEHQGKTQLPAPQAQTVDVMKRLEAAGSVPEIIRFCENQLGIAPFWLDVNRVAAKALALGGSRFVPALEAVEAESARLIGRLPGLADLSFANGQAFADPATRSWLAGLANANGTAIHDAAAGEFASQAIGEARTLAAAGQRREAAVRIQQEIAVADSAQKRFSLRLQLYEMLEAQGGPNQLTPFARILLADLDHFKLDEWDPQLALAGLRLAYRLLPASADYRSEGEAILARITLLDPATALGLLA